MDDEAEEKVRYLYKNRSKLFIEHRKKLLI